MKYLILLILILISGCSTSKLEQRITDLEDRQTNNAQSIIQWSETVEQRFNTLGTAVIRHEKILQLMNADGVRVQ